MSKRKKFWMLFAEGQGSPTNKHDNYLDALAEAKRLMNSKNMTRCYILEAVGVVEAERNLYHEEITYEEQEQTEKTFEGQMLVAADATF